MQQWCNRFNAGQQRSYSFEKYTEEVARQLAQYWSEMMQYFYSLALESGQELLYIYTDHDINNAPEPSPALVSVVEGSHLLTLALQSLLS